VNNESLLAEPVAAFCGVGNPQSFFNQLRKEGCTPVFTRAFTDHHEYNQADLNRLIEEAGNHGARGLITTAKDALKLAALQIELPCYVFEIEISIDDDARLMKMIQAACL
jgi:tetraacyldisaccharide 4'-kinase